MPSLAGWALGVFAGLALLTALAYVHGNEVRSGDDFVSSLHTTLTRPLVAASVAFAGLMLLGWCCRHLLLELLAWWPGRIVVAEFESSSEVKKGDLPRLTAEFRDRLARSHLQSPAPVPAPTQHGDFLEVLGRGTMDPGNIFATLFGLLRAAVPTHAYLVRGALVSRDRPRGCGITVHVERLAGEGSPARTFWDSSWDGAIRRGADHATASILPRTRLCNSPWSGWRGYRLPSDLLHAYERGAELEEGRRYDEALDAYYAALREDPMNIALRLQIGFLQEKLALFLDALATYESILEVSRPGENILELTPAETEAAVRTGAPTPDQVVIRRKRRDPHRRFYRSPARKDRDRILLVAQYRRAILLGGQELPRQWRQPSDPAKPTRRDTQRDQLRERLGPMLTELFVNAQKSSTVAAITCSSYECLADEEDKRGSAAPPTPKLRRPLRLRLIDRLRNGHDQVDTHEAATALELPAAKGAEGSLGRLRELFALAALHELARLRTELSGPGMRRGDSLSPAAIDLSGLWIQQHLRVVLAERDDGSDTRWLPTAGDLEKSVKAVEGRLGFRRWQENYNAACVYSLPLLLNGRCGLERKQSDALAGLAVQRLEQAGATADSGYVASRRDWVLSDDPDLDGLRAQVSFKRYEAMFFPSAWRTARRPRELHKWELSSYTFELLSAVAARWEQAWSGRKDALEASVNVGELASWCDVELEAWKRVRQVATHHRHWQTRAGLIKEMHRWQATQRFDPLDVAFPCFALSGWTPEEDEEIDVSAIVTANDSRLGRLARAVGRPNRRAGCASLIGDLGDWKAELARIDVTRWTVRRAQAARLCDSHAALWRAVARYLADADSTPRAAESRLAAAIAETEALWREVRSGWQPRLQHGARPSNGHGPQPGTREAAA